MFQLMCLLKVQVWVQLIKIPTQVLTVAGKHSTFSTRSQRFDAPETFLHQFRTHQHSSFPSLPIFNLSKCPPACHPGAAEPSLNNSNHCFCQLTSSGRCRQMWGHQCCPDANCFYQPSKCRYRVPAACLFACRPDILNPDPIWRPQHLNSQETFFFFFLQLPLSVFPSYMRNTSDGKHTVWLYICTPKKKNPSILHASKIITFTEM